MKNFEGIWKAALSLVVCVTALDASSGGASSCSVKRPPASCYGSGGPCSCSTPCLGPEVYASRPALFPKTCGGDFIVGAEFLYEKPSLEGFYLGAMQDRLVLPKSVFGPGIRIHLGFTMPEDGWYIRATGTALCPKMEGESDDESRVNVASVFSSRFKRTYDASFKPAAITVGGIGAAVPLVGVSTGVSDSLFYGSVDWDWELRSYVGDLALGRAYWLSKFVECDLHLGVRGVSFEQTWNIRQEDFKSASNSDFSFVELYSKYRGLGQLAGVDTRWHFGSGFAIYSKLALGALYGTSTVREGEFWEPSLETKQAKAGSKRAQIFMFPTNEKRCMSSFLDIGVGIDWDMVMCNGQYAFRLSVGWEGKRFGEQNQFVSFTPFLYPLQAGVVTALENTAGNTVGSLKPAAGAQPPVNVPGGVGVSGAAIDEMSGGLLLSGWTLGLDICF